MIRAELEREMRGYSARSKIRLFSERVAGRSPLPASCSLRKRVESGLLSAIATPFYYRQTISPKS